jgi:hypothetical protein
MWRRSSDANVDHIVVASGYYDLSSRLAPPSQQTATCGVLCITRPTRIEADLAGNVTLDAGATRGWVPPPSTADDGPAIDFLSSYHRGRVVYVNVARTESVELRGLRLTGGWAPRYGEESGGGLLVESGQVHVENCAIEYNWALSGGGIAVGWSEQVRSGNASNYADVVLVNTTVSNNVAHSPTSTIGGAGGVFIYGGSVALYHTRIFSNGAFGSAGGGVHIGLAFQCAACDETGSHSEELQPNNVTFVDSSVYLNTNLAHYPWEEGVNDTVTHETAGGVSVSKPLYWAVDLRVNVTFVRTHIYDNLCLADAAPGGLFWESSGTLTMDGCRVHGNLATRVPGGGIVAQRGTVFLSNGTRVYSNFVVSNGFRRQPDALQWVDLKALVPRWQSPPFNYVLRDEYEAIRDAARGLGHTREVNLYVPGGLVYYTFPVPAGHWLPNSDCRVFRALCPSIADRNRPFSTLDIAGAEARVCHASRAAVRCAAPSSPCLP